MKKKMTCLLLVLSMISVMLMGCGEGKKSTKESTKKTVKEKDDKKELTKSKSKKEKDMEKPAEEVIEEADSSEKQESAEPEETKETEEEEQTEETVDKVEGTTREVEIGGKKYLEITYSVIDGNDVYYKFENYAVTVTSPWEEVGSDLNGDEGSEEADFMICIQQPKKIRTENVVINYSDMENNIPQLGYTDFENGEMSEQSRTGATGTIRFGRAYYDYDSTLYVDVFVTVPKKMYSSTIAIPLK